MQSNGLDWDQLTSMVAQKTGPEYLREVVCLGQRLFPEAKTRRQ